MGGFQQVEREGIADWDCYSWFWGAVNAMAQNEEEGVWRVKWSSGLT